MTLFNIWLEAQNDKNYTGTPMQCVRVNLLKLATDGHIMLCLSTSSHSNERLSHIFTWGIDGIDPLADPGDSCHKRRSDRLRRYQYIHLRCRSIGGSGRFMSQQKVWPVTTFPVHSPEVSIHWRIRAIHVTTEGLAGYDVTSTFTWGIDPLADLGDSLPVPVCTCHH